MHEFDKETVVDKVFKKAVQEFQSSLISTYSVVMKVMCNILEKNPAKDRYKYLKKSFQNLDLLICIMMHESWQSSYDCRPW